MRKYASTFIVFVLVAVISFVGYRIFVNINTKKPTTLTLWHNYGGQMKDTMDEMIDEFNETVGIEEGIILSVTSISGSAALHDKLTMAANGDPGAPSLPDITTAYPKTALLLAEKGLLSDLNEQFTSEELLAYIPQFLEEGRLEGENLYVFPTAKSTEVLFVNTTIFNRFATDTGTSLEDLHTFEGIIKASALYYDWTDRQTPHTQHDGKMFFMSDSLFNFSLIGCKQLGTDFIKNDLIDFANPKLTKVWDYFYKPSVLGQEAIFDGYASDLAKTGDIVCYTGSTAGVLFFSPTVTYADNTIEPAELTLLPYPIFEGGKKLALQRGAGMCVTKSTKDKEYLAGVFLKWFTSPANNLRFVASTGYLPVTQEAFGVMTEELVTVTDGNIKKLNQIISEMEQQYEFYIPPLFHGLDELQSKYESKLKAFASKSREQYLLLLQDSNKEVAPDTVLVGNFEDFKEDFLTK